MILYHYCSNHVFQSIIEKREIWLSSLSLSNDSMEGQWLRKVLRDMCEERKLEIGATSRLIEHIDGFTKVVDGLGLCLSEHGDMLSQWRGYASDASGICIGFSKDYLEELSTASRSNENPGFNLTELVYGIQEQKNIVRPIYEKILEYVEAGVFKLPGRRLLLDTRSDEEIKIEEEKIKKLMNKMIFVMFEFLPVLFKLKNPAFGEEREWRLVSYLTRAAGDECKYRASLDRMTPYRTFEIPEKENGPISKVILGPKNITPTVVIEAFLNQYGFANVNVIRSEATYR